MRKQTVLKKLISSIIVAIIVLGQFSAYRFTSEAAVITGEDEMYLSLSKTNKNGENEIGYANVNEKYIWNIMVSSDATGTNEVSSSNLYCIKAEHGVTWGINPASRVEYNWSDDFNKDIETTPSEEVNKLTASEYFNAILWLIDNMYVPGESDKVKFLEAADIYYDGEGSYWYQAKNGYDYSGLSGVNDEYEYTLTDDDIVAIQQAALWYFTNNDDSDYNVKETVSWLRYTNNGEEYKTFSENVPGGKARNVFSYVLFNYLVDKAGDIAEELKATSQKYELKNTTAKLWLSTSGENDNNEQPVVEVHKIPAKLFDLSLRKAIVKIEDAEGNNKEIVNTNGQSAVRNLNENGSIKTVDTSSLTSGTTATYKHRKDPVVVEKGDTITYSITIYNEAEEDGYANKIVDQLPGTWGTGLRLENNQTTVTSTTGNIYNVQYETETNTIILTMADNSPKNILAGYTQTATLASETVLVKCKVMGKPDTANSKILTNIAYIAEEYNAGIDAIVTTKTEQDRDSQTWEYPHENNLVTENIGYTGKENLTDLSDSNKYYEGEQDDDDFEKVIILPKAFDLSLRKYITKVDGNEVDREPKIDETNLDNGTSTTADYNHRKDAVTVKNGSTVEYKISLYNEGSIAGVATIVRDQLPSGLKLNLEAFTKEGEDYFITSTKGNIYKVSYDQVNNLVTFELDKTKTTEVKLLNSHEIGKALDKDVITLQCTVDCKADNSENTFLTNIAYIYQAEQEDGTVVTNQTTGSDADRDSQPHTHPNETAEELKTIGNIGYKGNEENPSDLAQDDVHFKGEQDDDDFEKLVILPKAFDLSLRKYITKVDGEEVQNSRVPQIEITKLDNGTSTTADYNHRKDAVTVKNGSTVEYKISLYNEGSIAGVATIVRDQLPTGLELNKDYFDKEGEKYFVTSAKGNVYEVIYTEQTNLVEFKLDKTKTSTLKYLQVHEVGTKLDEDTIVLECKVNYIADQKQNTYFTNIAYIYEAEQEDGTVVTNQTSGSDSDRDSEPYTHPNETADELTTTGDVGYTGKETVTDLTHSNKYYEGEQDDDDFEKLVMLPKVFDLKLIKFITEINNEATGNRVISVDTSKLNTTSEETTADYILEKNPVSVKAGDFVTYTLRVYNEGNYDGYATEISESIPEGLEFIVITDGAIFSWDGTEQKDITEEIKASDMYNKIIEVNSNWGYDKESSIITTRALSEDLIKGFGQENVQYADDINKIDYKEVSVIFRVKEDITPNIIIRNEAAISEDKVVDKGEEIDIPDRDSKPEEWKKEDSDETYDEDGKWPIYEEDDEDYDNIVTKSFDLSLRKQIIKINDALYTQRFADLDANGDYENTLYDYYNVYNNKPKVKAGDIVVYSIRVYNEGEIDGYASLVVDTLPEGLEFYSSEYKGIDYGWTLLDGTENVYQTDYLSYEKDPNKGKENSTIIKAYDGEGEADYEEIFIVCKVKEDVSKEDSLLNVAQIAEDSDEDGNPIKDKDSIPGTSDDESKWKEEDDLDIEILQLQEFDLALRKFITKIENGDKVKEVTSRIPQVSYNEETEQIEYTHPKDALVVHVGDTVIYTIRVYNEGQIDGYAAEVKDDIPEYLEYLPEHSTNKEYEWVMYDEEGNETEDVENAVFIKTEHLAKGNGAEKETEKANLLKAFDPNSELSEKNPDYRDVEVAFKVKDPNSTEYEIINFAQISEDTDSEGDPIKDKDSVTDNGKEEPKEDEEDIEKIKVEYFDLSLLKYVTKVFVNENGQERVIETGNVGDENDIIPHVQINKKNIDKTVVKFAYTIKITNEGQIAGEATEITDYVPQGLVFVAEDNEHWTDEGNNVISTKQLTGTTLQPGESVEVEVILRWVNGADNLGPKTNVAEISEDYNEENVPDIDSTPDNKKDGEDDIDDATVLLSVNQGGGIQSIYINLTITFLAIILVGGILIKKFVL